MKERSPASVNPERTYRNLQYLYQHTDWLNSSALLTSNRDDLPKRSWAQAIIGTGV